MPALLGWGSFGRGVWGVPWGRGRKDALGTLNGSPFGMLWIFPFGTSLLETFGVLVASFLLPGYHSSQASFEAALDYMHGKSGAWEQDLVSPETALLLDGSSPFAFQLCPVSPPGRGGVSSSQMSGFSLSTPFFYHVGLGG